MVRWIFQETGTGEEENGVGLEKCYALRRSQEGFDHDIGFRGPMDLGSPHPGV